MNLQNTFETSSFSKETPLPVTGVIRGLPDDELLDIIQRQTLRYFWENGHPVNGMARERKMYEAYTHYDCDETVTTGGTGFGIMGMLAGAERGWLPRHEVRGRLEKIVGFLEDSETHHGVFPHFIDSKTGRANFFKKTIIDGVEYSVPAEEAGGNIVETAFLVMGLLSARQYFSNDQKDEIRLAERINKLWHGIEWNSHLSPDGKNIQWLNHPETGLGNWPVTGWNEAVVTHILAVSSPTHAVPASVYDTGWASGQDFFKNGKTYYGHSVPLGPPGAGPLFFSHYSFLGLDPRGLKDKYADYWEQNIAQTLVNQAYCTVNPHNYKEYSDKCWGLTASDTATDKKRGGYCVHKPDDPDGVIGSSDHGTITPTAALSSFPYAPKEAMGALRYFYEERGDELWTDFGFVDAFNPQQEWVAKSHLAIDQGPIVGMIENHRSGLLWNCFMSCPEIQNGLEKLGFESPHLEKGQAYERQKTIWYEVGAPFAPSQP